MKIRLSKFIKLIEERIPPKLAIKGDKIGMITPFDEIKVTRVLLLMDYLNTDKISYGDYDMLILHHPPPIKPPIPTYVIHSNWDTIKGGACEALAEKLKLKVTGPLDERGIGRICETRKYTTLDIFITGVAEKLKIRDLRVVNFKEDLEVKSLAIVPGFGLNPAMIKKAHNKGAKVYLSGDLTHEGAIIAKNLDLTLIDASHYASELPGLYRLAETLKEMGVKVDVIDTKTPWETRCIP